MTQKEIAEKAGISQQLLCDFLRGRTNLSRESAKRLEKVTGIPRLAWLYPDEHKNPLRKVEERDAGSATTYTWIGAPETDLILFWVLAYGPGGSAIQVRHMVCSDYGLPVTIPVEAEGLRSN